MMLEDGTKAIHIKRDELKAILAKNRAEHAARFEKAMGAYRERAIAELDSAIADARAGRRIQRQLSLPEPMNQTKDYDRAIRMLEL